MPAEDLVAAAKAEEESLLAQIRKTELYQRLEAVRAVIALYAPKQPAAPPPSPPMPERPFDRLRVRLNEGERGSKTAAIVNGAAEYLRIKGKRATSGEIARALEARGIEIGGEAPNKLVSSYLSNSPLFDNDQDAGGYGLAAWSTEAVR